MIGALTIATVLASAVTGAEPAPVDADAAPAGRPLLADMKECKDTLDISIFVSPRAPRATDPMRIMVVSHDDIPNAEIQVMGPDGEQVPVEFTEHGGPPHGWVATIDAPTAGRWKLGFGTSESWVACQKVVVRRRRGKVNQDIIEGEDPVWKAHFKWERDVENLYALWIEHLFDAPVDEDISWRPLSEVLRNRQRNLLFDHKGMDEDGPGKLAMRLKPDCADFPYFLRAYFAWKLSLPFGYRPCRRGNATRAPSCGEVRTNEQVSEKPLRRQAVEQFLRRRIASTVHSSSPRTRPKDEKSDLYPVAMTRSSLRPGTTFSDPYGHTMVVARWYDGEVGESGVLMAIDAQPDGTIGRRLFWRGSFLFPEDGAVTGAGFKRFRPLYRDREGNLKAMTNREIAANTIDYGDYSLEQWENGKQAFYDRMDELITPHALPPDKALLATIDALDQQLRRRIESVDNGEQWKRENPGATMAMPEGPAIFVTSGPWEAYSTPSRDMRVLIAVDAVRDFPSRVERLPERFVLPDSQSAADAKASMQALLAAEAAKRTFVYTRSDGSKWTLTMADIMSRTTPFEYAYNPNDCVEIRWGASPDTDEYATCTTHAPQKHLDLMTSYREWFQRRMRPVH